jgi:hypothetical protein
MISTEPFLCIINQKEDYHSVVLPPRVAAFDAPEKPHLALICSPELAQPPESKVVAALRAPDLDGGHSVDLFILVIDNGDLVLGALPLFEHLVSPANLPDIAAFPALELTPRRDQHGFTFRAEHCYIHALPKKMNLWMIPRRCLQEG